VKTSKSTTILLDLVLLLVMILLVKSLIAMPRNLYAKAPVEYKVVDLKPVNNLPDLQKLLDDMSNQGWKLHSTNFWKLSWAIFER